ncbi:hypothetical protein [Nostoc sp.]|uniref:hypothetical protein n=1 Tax=Nostoc sp. TaxID=1180 RepID=UPI002FF9E188
MESLRQLETENQQLQQRIQELEHAVEKRPSQEWGNTMTQQATKALNKQVKQALEKTIDLRSLAVEPPKENATECLRLMGMALKNLASAMNNTQALEAAAIILGSEPTQEAIAYRAEQLQLLPQAVSDIRAVLAKPGCTWQDYCVVATEYEVIKGDYWAELTTKETDLIRALEKATHSRVIQVGSIVSDTLTGNSREEKTAHAPLGVASPQSVEGVSEKEKELPVVTDCTTLALVEAAPSQSTSLLAENQDCGVDPKDRHVRAASLRVGTCSAAPLAQNEFCLSLAIANQTQGQVEQGNPTSLLVENSVSGGETKAVNEGESSAAPLTSAEKWSHEAIVARSNMRPVRREKLNRATNSGDNPGFDFLQECWNDDPALQIVIKKLLVKFPQWGIAIVDVVLVDWED